MPILVPDPPSPAQPRPRGTRPALTLIRGTTSLPLTEHAGWTILPGVEGLDDPPRTLIAVEPALWDGEQPTGVRFAPREVFLPLHYSGASTEQLRATIRSLATLTNPKHGAVTLLVSHADGTRRWIDGQSKEPLAGALALGEGALHRTLGVTLRCPDPHWLSDERSITWSVGGSMPSLLSPTFLPLRLAESQVVGQQTITNTADADAACVWTITGPLTTASVTLDGQTWTIVAPGLTAAETLTVDTRRGVQSVTVNGVNAWGRLGPGARFATIPAGTSTVSVIATGATAATVMTIAWRERWLTAW